MNTLIYEYKMRIFDCPWMKRNVYLAKSKNGDVIHSDILSKSARVKQIKIYDFLHDYKSTRKWHVKTTASSKHNNQYNLFGKIDSTWHTLTSKYLNFTKKQ